MKPQLGARNHKSGRVPQVRTSDSLPRLANFLTREVTTQPPKQNCHPERTPDFLLRGTRDGHVCGFH
jgi:hypothetical protein